MRRKETETTPRARKEGLLVQELSDEVLVYDLECDKAHCLNPTAALVWKYCDGHTTVEQITRLLEKSLGTIVDEDVVWCALNQLEKDKLLGEQVTWPVGMERISRRTLIRRVGMAAVLLPLITTITAPTAMASNSNCIPPSGTGCNALPCCNGATCVGNACP